ncbi:acetyl-CoA carboxylase [Streptomyces viridochromogenes]|uniref:Acetyl-coenzyme A carboxylase carboxyl transferase subunits beta/alpha n=1 Tax=Streptomyces viridochromogenes TaxID=1938 RepID=A0A0J7YUF1_STRVR|nr:carboxyl transferase domain-containing protein [Streptomyces viridochromogenes]KMS67124.1 acetyl-CoA carboxylase [Streptomyces viridochromogenes]KOG25698.1 acetyl-CoA carboxylase [Streptomyces viridochromogenes]KOG26680.1 acetyl-CoA carboxylase [Streptomyces viridochromogenes]
MTERRTAREALALVTEDFAELPYPARDSAPDGPLAWHGYDASRARAAERTGEEESVVCGTATVEGTRAVLIAFEFGFLGGSLGERTGDRLETAYTCARARRLPVVALVATGGSRMQEGMSALTQLQRVARQSILTREAGLPQIAVLRDPTTGGGWATLGAGADVTLALPGAQVGFAGSRVRPPDADPAAYTAEAQVVAGSVDAVVRPEELRQSLGCWLRLLTAPSTAPAPPPRHLGTTGPPTTGWDAVRRARSPLRPCAEAYLAAYFTHRVAISGDRCGGADPDGMLCGFGAHEGRTVAYAAQTGAATRPAGYRTAARLIRLADRLGIPVLTLVDTPGAANDADAERQGVGAAIADLFGAVAGARVPVTTLVVGEGGSGGALALAAPGNTWATPDSYFSVIAPELAAAILKRGPEEVEATADQLRIRPQDLVELGVIRGVVGGPSGSAP